MEISRTPLSQLLALLAVTIVPLLNTNASESVFKHSDVALMPEWEPDDLRVQDVLSPTVIAWGNDPVFNTDEQLQQKSEVYRNMGIRLMATNIWMLTATERYLHEHPEMQDAVCRDIEGRGIIPPWIADASYEGTPAYWGCTNHPLFRRQVLERLRRGMDAGADLLHLDDHLGTVAALEHEGGCFCEYCMEGFRMWLEEHRPELLNALEDGDSRVFDYGVYLKEQGVETMDRYRAQVDSLPLRLEFLQFQREAAVRWVALLKSEAGTLRSHDVPLGINGFNLLPFQLLNAHQADFLANEVSCFDVEESNPPFVYQLADAIGCPIFATATGEDWVQVMERGDVVRVQRWIADAYAFGNYFMYA